jgi:protocatechuate 3,4-dioxygenase alpha subunit
MTLARTPGLSPSQTVGPFFLDCLLRPDARRNVLAQPETVGDRIHIEGRVIDGDGVGVPDALVEIWQANSHGRYNHPADTRDTALLDRSFIGFGRSGTDEEGYYWFETIKPGPVPFSPSRVSDAHDIGAEMQAPHISIIIFARGLLNHLITRLYFADEPATADDPILSHVPSERRETIIAKPQAGDGHTLYRWDIILQGPNETVFFNV